MLRILCGLENMFAFKSNLKKKVQNGEGLVSKVKVALAKLNPVGPRSSCCYWEEVGDPAHRDEVILGGSKG